MKIKRFTSLLLALTLISNMLYVLPIEVFAAAADSKVYEKDGYTVALNN